jgi:hypothetical protein
MQYFPVSSATRVSSVDQQRHTPYHPHSVSIAKWLQSGFNATVVNYGPKYDLKTTTVFGPQMPLKSLQQPEHSIKSTSPTLVSEILGQLYNPGIDDRHIPSVPLPSPGTIAISMWYLQNNTVVDVCASTTTTRKPSSNKNERNDLSSSDDKLEKEWLQFVSVECSDYNTAMKVIQTGRSRCPHHDEHHVFLRILLYRPERTTGNSNPSLQYSQKGSLSHLHLVDLVNASSVDTEEHRHLPTESNRIARR